MMSKVGNSVSFSPIAPLSVLIGLHNNDALGNYLLLLAHDVLKHPEGYVELMGACASVGRLPFIIMDNGTIELDGPLPAEKVVEAAAVVDANCIVIPDVLGNSRETIDKVNNDLDFLRDCGYPLMVVPQGTTPKQVMTTIQWLVSNVTVSYWGIPRWLTNSNLHGTRKHIINVINNTYGASQKIHLLGMSSNLVDDIECCQMNNVMGIDSANPLVLGQYGRNLKHGDLYIHMDRGDYWEQGLVTSTVIDNIQYIRRQIVGA